MIINEYEIIKACFLRIKFNFAFIDKFLFFINFVFKEIINMLFFNDLYLKLK